MTLFSKAIIATFLSINHVASGFIVPSSSLSKVSHLNSAVVGEEINGFTNKKSWDCDEDANCVQVDACNEMECRTSLDVRIHGQWYDLSGEHT